MSKKWIWKSADTGEIVSDQYAQMNPKECYKHYLDEEGPSKRLHENVILNDEDYAIKLIPDYFSKIKEKEGGFDASMKENDDFHVGVIEAVGQKLSENLVGKIIYFQKNVSNIVKIPGFGVFHLVDDRHQKLLIRKDQTRDNLNSI